MSTTPEAVKQSAAFALGKLAETLDELAKTLEYECPYHPELLVLVGRAQAQRDDVSRAMRQDAEQSIEIGRGEPPLKALPSVLPVDGFVRLPVILRVFPVSKSTWWAGVRSGRFPPAIKLGPKTTAWRASAIRELIEAAK